MGEDAIFCQQYFKYARYITCISDFLYHYVRGVLSVTMKYDPKFVDYEKYVIKAISDSFTQYPLCEKEQSVMNAWYREKIFGCLWYYRERKNKRVISASELRDRVREIKGIEAYGDLSMGNHIKLSLFAPPKLSSILR